MQCGAPHGLMFGSMQSLNIRRIEAGILDSGSDFDSSMMPAAGLSRFVDAGNSSFIGREAIFAHAGKTGFLACCVKSMCLLVAAWCLTVMMRLASSPLARIHPNLTLVSAMSALPWPTPGKAGASRSDRATGRCINAGLLRCPSMTGTNGLPEPPGLTAAFDIIAGAEE